MFDITAVGSTRDFGSDIRIGITRFVLVDTRLHYSRTMADLIVKMKKELKGILEDIKELTLNLESEDDETKKIEIQGKIDAAETSRTQLKTRLVEAIEIDCLSSKDEEGAPTVDSKSVALPSTSSDDVITFRERSHAACSNVNLRIKQPKEYKNGEDFSTFCYRFKIFVEANKTSKSDYSNVLLSCVDDITLQKLMPVIENLTDCERRDIRVLLDTCRETLYPKSEMRALRQQLTSAKIVQTGEEEVEEFAARIRSIVNRAGYTTEADKSEACLNAFLNGLNAELADKLYAAPDVENSFEIAVSTARKLEKMRKVRASPAITEPDILSSVFRVSESRGSRDQQQNRSHTERSQEQQDLLSQASNYGRQERSSAHQPRHTNSGQQGTSEKKVRPENRTCFRCGVKGHIARYCRAAEPLNS